MMGSTYIPGLLGESGGGLDGGCYVHLGGLLGGNGQFDPCLTFPIRI